MKRHCHAHYPLARFHLCLETEIDMGDCLFDDLPGKNGITPCFLGVAEVSRQQPHAEEKARQEFLVRVFMERQARADSIFSRNMFGRDVLCNLSRWPRSIVRRSALELQRDLGLAGLPRLEDEGDVELERALGVFDRADRLEDESQATQEGLGMESHGHGPPEDLRRGVSATCTRHVSRRGSPWTTFDPLSDCIHPSATAQHSL